MMVRRAPRFLANRWLVPHVVLALGLLAGAGPVAGAGAGPGAPTGTRAFEIQGAAHRSPLAGQPVHDVPGVVTALRSNGFSLQDAEGDGDPATSDGIFVFTRVAPAVAVGDDVRVSGIVRELRPGNDEANLSTTEIDAESVRVVAHGVPLPAPVLLGPRGWAAPAQVVAEGIVGDAEEQPALQTALSALDAYESLEGMRVQVNDAVVVGRRSGQGELPVLPDDGAGLDPIRRTARGGLLAASPGEAPPLVVLADGAIRTPAANVGDRLPGMTVGVLEYAFGGYRVRVSALPPLVAGGLAPERAAPASDPHELTIATFNVENLSARERPAKLALLAETIVQRLGAPDLLALQEIQDDSGAGDDGTVTAVRTAGALIAAIRAAGGPEYTYRDIDPVNNQDGGEPGGNIRVGFLIRTDRGLMLVDRPGGDAVTAVAPVAGSDGARLSISPGRIAPGDPAWAESRKPLAAELTFNGHRLIVVANHFVSKRGSAPPFGRFQPPARPTEAQRIEQARLVNGFARAVLAADPAAKLVVLGDLNDGPGSATLAALADGVLTNLFETLPGGERYSYVFAGQSEAIDQILVSPALLATGPALDVVHGNAEHVGSPSDHDPALARFRLPPP